MTNPHQHLQGQAESNNKEFKLRILKFHSEDQGLKVGIDLSPALITCCTAHLLLQTTIQLRQLSHFSSSVAPQPPPTLPPPPPPLPAAWHTRPADGMEFRVGGTGAGLLVGCGAGLGFLTPLQLHSIPVLGQLASGLGQGLGSADAALGGLGGALRRRARGLGVKGLDLGAGCGVMVNGAGGPAPRLGRAGRPGCAQAAGQFPRASCAPPSCQAAAPQRP